ncbi:hypothetical protein AGR1A_Cc30316 [Agrobacterium fabacearum CFBP 5771]|nr:hypothetical protein AGR1A_Cc30316 [Agrobacterium fabacearum CFBP 5771]
MVEFLRLVKNYTLAFFSKDLRGIINRDVHYLLAVIVTESHEHWCCSMKNYHRILP